MSLHYIQGTGPAATPLFYPQIDPLVANAVAMDSLEGRTWEGITERITQVFLFKAAVMAFYID